MRKLFFLLAGILSLSLSAQAAPGDTTWVQANKVQLNYYNNFDTAVTFPTGSYRKIYMIFTLGKYVCPTGSQYCGDWDYTVQTFFMGSSSPDTVELGRFMTPYAHTGTGRFTAGWTNRYIFDVSDYFSVLRNNGKIRIHYSGYSGGFTANVKFAFVEGIPERRVTGVDRFWHGDFAYGHGSTPINTALGSITKTAPTGTVSSELKMNVTGHGGDDQGCAEFCPNVYTIAQNGTQLVQQQFYRSDCANNDLYAQSGTWIWARANWCPGALVYTIPHKLNNVNGGTTYSLAMTFPNYTSATTGGGNPASYTIDAATIYYGATNKVLDASMEDIIAPTDAEYHWRDNPTSYQPRFMVRNSGSTPISSIAFEYGVVGKPTRSYTWTGSLPSLTSMEIDMPAMADLMLRPGSYQFMARINKVNGSSDSDRLNDTLTSYFTAAPTMPADFIVQLQANAESLPSNSAVSQTAWHIEDMNGHVVAKRADCPIGTICMDTVHLLNATAYKLIVTDSERFGYYSISAGTTVALSHGDGLSGFSTTTGSFRLFDMDYFPLNDPAGYMGGNFGNGFSQYFYVGNPTGIQQQNAAAAALRVFPNPTSGKAFVMVEGLSTSGGELQLFDITGRTVATQHYTKGMQQMDLSRLSNGIYQMVFTSGAMRLQQRVSIAR